MLSAHSVLLDYIKIKLDMINNEFHVYEKNFLLWGPNDE